VSDSLVESYLAALAAMERRGPRDLHRKAADEAEYFEAGLKVGDGPLREHLATALPGDLLRRALHLRLVDWDFLPADVDWTEGTQPNTRERREVMLRRLNVDGETSRLFGRLFPVADADETVVIAKNWEPWYSRETLAERGFYWNHYSDYLLEKRGWAPEAVAKLDAATDHVVERLSEPARGDAYQAKGLVVGYVQSGKTANFTGVVAKAIDVGYRLIIVLTGTTEVLRDQTQRRLDMELVGEENILRGISPSNHDALDAVDYCHTDDWANGKFVRHGCQPADIGSPDIHRMTTHKFDYRSLRQGISALDFERRDRTLPLYDPVNLFASDARLAIVKKNSTVLNKLVNDLKAITARLTDIPVLIIDDESDQASVDTGDQPILGFFNAVVVVQKLWFPVYGSCVSRTTLAPVERHASVTSTTSANGNVPSAFIRTTFSFLFWKNCLSVLCRAAHGMFSSSTFRVGFRGPELSTCTTIASDLEGNRRPTDTSSPFGGTRVSDSDESRWAVSKFSASTSAVCAASRTFSTLAYGVRASALM